VAVRTRKTANNPGGVLAERRDFPTSRKNGEKRGTPRQALGSGVRKVKVPTLSQKARQGWGTRSCFMLQASGRGRAENNMRQGFAIQRAHRTERVKRALSIAIPVLAYIWR
jgi:hypothetical protein